MTKSFKLCLYCKKPYTPNTSRKYCSDECRDESYKPYKALRKEKYRQALKLQGKQLSGDQLVCALVLCSRQFVARYSQQRFCQDSCRQSYNSKDAISRGDIEASRVYFGQCKYCEAWKSTRAKTMINRLSCLDCQKRRTKENDTRKNHRRRAAGELVMTVQSLAERDGIKCNICTKPVNMSKSGRDPLGPTIDHLLPVSKGGTNDSFNLALAHRRCNTSRGNRGHAQLLLEITDAWATTKTA